MGGHVRSRQVKMRAAVLDIETSSLAVVGPGSGFLCAVFKPLFSDTIILWRHDLSTHRGAIRNTIETLSTFDLIIGHNVQRFDLPMLFSFAGVEGLNIPFPNPLVYDTLPAFRRIGYCTTMTPKGYRRASLAFAIDYFWPDENEKTAIYPHWHERAFDKGAGGTKAMADVVSHCISDVRMNERLYWRILQDDRKVLIRRWR